jgi:hypothetical protein
MRHTQRMALGLLLFTSIAAGCSVAAEAAVPTANVRAPVAAAAEASEAERYLPDLREAAPSLELLNAGERTEWRSDQPWEVVAFAPEGLEGGHYQLYREPDGLHGVLTVREQALVYGNAQQASAALQAAATEFLRTPTLLQEGGLRTPAQPYRPAPASYGDETWAATWTDVYGVEGYVCLARYGNLVILVTASQRELSMETVAGCHRLIEGQIAQARPGWAPGLAAA